MLYQVNDVYIQAGSEGRAFAKYAEYCHDFSHFGEDIAINTNIEVKEISKLTIKKYFTPIFEKVQSEYPDAYFCEDRYETDIMLVLKENKKGQKVMLLLLTEQTSGVYSFGAGVCDDNELTCTMLSDTNDLNKLIKDINEEVEYYALKL